MSWETCTALPRNQASTSVNEIEICNNIQGLDGITQDRREGIKKQNIFINKKSVDSKELNKKSGCFNCGFFCNQSETMKRDIDENAYSTNLENNQKNGDLTDSYQPLTTKNKCGSNIELPEPKLDNINKKSPKDVNIYKNSPDEVNVNNYFPDEVNINKNSPDKIEPLTKRAIIKNVRTDNQTEQTIIKFNEKPTGLATKSESSLNEASIEIVSVKSIIYSSTPGFAVDPNNSNLKNGPSSPNSEINKKVLFNKTRIESTNSITIQSDNDTHSITITDVYGKNIVGETEVNKNNEKPLDNQRVPENNDFRFKDTKTDGEVTNKINYNSISKKEIQKTWSNDNCSDKSERVEDNLCMACINSNMVDSPPTNIIIKNSINALKQETCPCSFRDFPDQTSYNKKSENLTTNCAVDVSKPNNGFTNTNYAAEDKRQKCAQNIGRHQEKSFEDLKHTIQPTISDVKTNNSCSVELKCPNNTPEQQYSNQYKETIETIGLPDTYSLKDSSFMQKFKCLHQHYLNEEKHKKSSSKQEATNINDDQENLKRNLDLPYLNLNREYIYDIGARHHDEQADICSQNENKQFEEQENLNTPENLQQKDQSCGTETVDNIKIKQIDKSNYNSENMNNFCLPGTSKFQDTSNALDGTICLPRISTNINDEQVKMAAGQQLQDPVKMFKPEPNKVGKDIGNVNSKFEEKIISAEEDVQRPKNLYNDQQINKIPLTLSSNAPKKSCCICGNKTLQRELATSVNEEIIEQEILRQKPLTTTSQCKRDKDTQSSFVSKDFKAWDAFETCKMAKGNNKKNASTITDGRAGSVTSQVNSLYNTNQVINKTESINTYILRDTDPSTPSKCHQTINIESVKKNSDRATQTAMGSYETFVVENVCSCLKSTQRNVTTYRNKDGTLCFKIIPCSDVNQQKMKNLSVELKNKGTSVELRNKVVQEDEIQNVRKLEEAKEFDQSYNLLIPPMKPERLNTTDIIKQDTMYTKDDITSTKGNNTRKSIGGISKNSDTSVTDLKDKLKTVTAELEYYKGLHKKPIPEDTQRPMRNKEDTSWDEHEHILKPGKAMHTMNETPRCIFTFHIGTMILSDEAVLSSTKKSLILTWKFYDQNLSMARMQAERVMFFDFSTDYDTRLTDDFLKYMKQEEMTIVISDMDNQEKSFATCVLPLRDALLHVNGRVDVSLVLKAGPQMLTARKQNKSSNDTLDTGDEIGVVDLWYMLRTDAKLIPVINSTIAETLNSNRLSQDVKPVSPNSEADNCTNVPRVKAHKCLEQSLLDMRQTGSVLQHWDRTPTRVPTLNAKTEVPSYDFPASQPRRHREKSIVPITNVKEKDEILVNEVVANIKTSEDMKHAMENTYQRNIHNVTRLPKTDADKVSQTQSSVATLLYKNGEIPSLRHLRGNRGGLNNKSKPEEIQKDQIETPLKEEHGTLDITILWLALNEECDAMFNPLVQRIYVAYSFLGRSGADLETPSSMPKPKHHMDKCYFNFKKTFQLKDDDISRLAHLGRCRYSSKCNNKTSDCIFFSVISEPPEDPLGLDACEDIGYAYLYLGDVLAYSTDNYGYTEVIPVKCCGKPAVCGVLAVRVDGLDVIRHCIEITASEYGPQY